MTPCVSCEQWYVSTEELLPLTVVQAYSAPNCYSNTSMPWTTYVIYQVRRVGAHECQPCTHAPRVAV